MVPVCRKGVPVHKQAKPWPALHDGVFDVSPFDQSCDLVAHAAVGLFGLCGEGGLRGPAFTGVAGITGERAEDSEGMRRGNVLLDGPCQGAIAHGASPARRPCAAGSDSVILVWVIGMFSPLDERKPTENQGAQRYRKKMLALIRSIWNIGVARLNLQKRPVSTVWPDFAGEI
jgi:hypothetical protein